MTQPWPWHDLDYVYGEHFLEHLPLDDAIRFLGQAAAGLRPDGRLRLSTPGLEWIWRTNFSPSGPNAEMVAMTYRINRSFYGWGHRFLYSRPMLSTFSSAAGSPTSPSTNSGRAPSPSSAWQHGGFDVVNSWPSVWIVEAVPAGMASATALMAEAEHELGATPPFGSIQTAKLESTPSARPTRSRRSAASWAANGNCGSSEV